MSRQGKIARLPHALREQVNRRLLNGGTAREILAWLNAEPQAINIWKSRFKGLEASPQNLSEWTGGGYVDWLRRRDKAENLKTLSAYAMELAKSGGSISDGAAAIAGGRLLEVLESVADDEDADLSEITLAVSRLRKGDRDIEKLALANLKEKNREKRDELDREKFEIMAVEKLIEWGQREEAQDILSSGKPQNIQVDLLREMIWGPIDDGGDDA